MNKLLRITLFSSIFLITQMGLGQTIVSTSPQTKNVVLEEFGGIYCVFCPEGHRLIQEFRTDYPNQIVHLNYQTGIYAVPNGNDPDYDSEYGNHILHQSGTTGYPSATINRTVFNGYEQGAPWTTAISRWDWEFAVNQTIDQVAVVNIAATAVVNISSKTLDVYVEYYYTGNSSSFHDDIHVALLQNEIIGPQFGGGQGDGYLHENVFRTFMTGQWGEPISQNTVGTFGSRVYSCVLPDDYRDIPFDPFNLKIAIFISNTSGEVLNGIEVTPSYELSNDIDLNALWLKSSKQLCQEPILTQMKVRNEGTTAISSFVIDYSLGGTSWEYQWNGILPSLASMVIDLPEIPFEEIPTGTSDSISLHTSISAPNNLEDQNLINNSRDFTFFLAPSANQYDLELNIQTDDYGYDIYWAVLNDNNDVIFSGGNTTLVFSSGGEQIAMPSDPGAYANNQSIVEYINLPHEGCYKLIIIDDYGDGLCCENGLGYYVLTNSNGDVILDGGTFLEKDRRLFSYHVELVAANDWQILEDQITLSPVPITDGYLNFKFNREIDLEVYTVDIINISGQIIKSEVQFLSANAGQVVVDDLASGVYFFRLTSEGESLLKRFIVTD